MTRILFSQLSYAITGLCFKTQNKLGRFCREKQYADFLETLLKEKKISHEREVNLNNSDIGGNKADFLIDEKIIVDLKAKKFITKEDYNQMQRYLQG